MLQNSFLAKHVLIVEDDYAIRQMYALKLINAGYIVDTAENGKEGLSKAELTKPDLILLDLRMPEMSGTDMLIAVREKSWGSTIKVIILTNLSKDEAPQSMRLLAVNRYVVKAHHTPSQLLEIVQEII